MKKMKVGTNKQNFEYQSNHREIKSKLLTIECGTIQIG